MGRLRLKPVILLKTSPSCRCARWTFGVGQLPNNQVAVVGALQLLGLFALQPPAM
jgi:hypothetical protein